MIKPLQKFQGCATWSSRTTSPLKILSGHVLAVKIYLLQSRPITTLANNKDDGSASIKAPTVNEFDFTIRDTDWITTCNAQEMFPGPGNTTDNFDIWKGD